MVIMALAAAAGLAGCGVRGTEAAVSVEASLPSACSVVGPVAVQAALGVDAARVAGPEVVGPDACNWHSGDPTCTMRSLGLQLVHGPEARTGFDQTRLSEVVRSDTDGFGEAAFFSTTVMPAGAGIQVERLEVRQGDRWYRFSATGRLGDNGRGILTAVATSVFAPQVATS